MAEESEPRGGEAMPRWVLALGAVTSVVTALGGAAAGLMQRQEQEHQQRLEAAQQSYAVLQQYLEQPSDSIESRKAVLRFVRGEALSRQDGCAQVDADCPDPDAFGCALTGLGLWADRELRRECAHEHTEREELARAGTRRAAAVEEHLRLETERDALAVAPSGPRWDEARQRVTRRAKEVADDRAAADAAVEQSTVALDGTAELPVALVEVALTGVRCTSPPCAVDLSLLAGSVPVYTVRGLRVPSDAAAPRHAATVEALKGGFLPVDAVVHKALDASAPEGFGQLPFLCDATTLQVDDALTAPVSVELPCRQAATALILAVTVRAAPG